MTDENYISIHSVRKFEGFILDVTVQTFQVNLIEYTVCMGERENKVTRGIN